MAEPSVPLGLIGSFPPGPGEGVGGLNVGRAAEEDEPDDERRRRARLKDVEPAPSFGAVAQSSQFQPMLERYQQSQTDLRAGARARSEAIAPAIEGARAAIAQTSVPPPPPPAVVSPPPSRQLTEFLAPVEGEHPANTISKFIQGVGLLATGWVAGKSGAHETLAALTGALKGWQEGDKERADRHFADWQAKSETLLKNAEKQRQHWKDIVEEKGLTMQQRMAMLDLNIRQSGIYLDPLKLQAEGDRALLDIVTKHEQALATLQLADRRLTEGLAEKRREADEKAALRNREIRLKEDEAKLFMGLFGGAGGAGAAGGAGPMSKVIDNLAEQWENGSNLTELTRGYGKYSTAVIFAAQQRAVEHAAKEGRGGAAMLLARRSTKANSEALTRITKEEADFNAFLISFENTVQNAKRLSDIVDRTSVPAWNRRQLEYQANIKGDANAKNLISQMEILAREGNRVMDRAKGVGAEHSKEEARKLYDPAMTKEMFDSLLANVLSKDALYGLMGFEQEKAALQKAIANPYEGIAPGLRGPAEAPGGALPAHAHREGNDIVSDSGKYIWRDGKWQAR